MKNTKSFVAGMLTTGLIMSLTFGAAASVREQLIKAEFADIKLVLDGTTIVPKDADGKIVEPFIYNGSTYLPIRSVGEAFDKTVTWDAVSKTATLTSKGAPVAYSRSNPAPLNKSQTVTYATYSDGYTADVVVTDIIRGEAAKTKLTAADKIVANPPEGMEYLLAKVKATVSNVKNDKNVELTADSLKAYSTDNAEYPAVSDIHMDQEFKGKVYSGGSVEGYVVFMVNKTDLAPKTVFGAAADGTGGVWFRLVK